jgi:acetylornithine deacetylase/succinyl-diaminopimelate desuccinylase-like protein
VKAIEYARSNQHRFLTELKEFLSIPSVSTQEKHKPDVERAATWLRDKLLSAGFPKAEVMLTPGHPVVYAEWLTAGPDAPTILIYGHYDVQPPDPLELWNTPPFEPTVIDDDIFARGAADDKGQLYIHVKAVEAFAETSEAGAPPINIKAIFEGEEEIGSPSLEPFIRAHADLLSADVAVISDTHMLGKDMPSIAYALRGLACFELAVTGPDHDLHSGAYGGAVHNPINALCDKVRQLDAAERAALARIPFERQPWLRETGAPTDWGEPAYTILERLTARPTLDVNGIWGGYTEPGTKTVLPSEAFAKISMRLVPDQDPAEIAQLRSPPPPSTSRSSAWRVERLRSWTETVPRCRQHARPMPQPLARSRSLRVKEARFLSSLCFRKPWGSRQS